MGLADVAGRLTISVVFSPLAGTVHEVAVVLDEGATVADALRMSDLHKRHPQHDLSGWPMGVWGILCEPTQRLRDHDRVELYRPLTVDPKEARRLRFRANRVQSNRKSPGQASPNQASQNPTSSK